MEFTEGTVKKNTFSCNRANLIKATKFPKNKK